MMYFQYYFRLLVLLSLTMGFGSPLYAEIREVRVGVYANEPKNLLDNEGNISGIFGDILTEIASQEGWILKPVNCEWDKCLQLLQSNQIDLMPDMAYSQKRAKIYDYHQIVVLNNWSAIYRRRDVTVNSMLDLQGKRVTVLEGSIQETNLRKMLTDFGVEAELIQAKLLDEGFEKVAENGKEAVALASKKSYDLILMDMQMPQMNGLDAAREIRKLASGGNVPIIALTGNAFGDDKTRCLQAGMNDFITKPFNMKTLFETILKFLA